MAFANIQRSLKVVEEVWQRYEDGGAWVDWLDVVSEFDWELFVV
jgi:transcriptional activator protein UGA3